MKVKEEQRTFNILLADDDRDDRFFFDKILKEIPVSTKLKTVPDGEHLMIYLTREKVNLPDVLFLDLNMPRKNGSECLTEIKSNSKLKDIPVIIYSTSVRDEIADILYDNGAHYYIHKFDFPELKKSIQKVLELLEDNPAPPSREKFVIGF